MRKEEDERSSRVWPMILLLKRALKVYSVLWVGTKYLEFISRNRHFPLQAPDRRQEERDKVQSRYCSSTEYSMQYTCSRVYCTRADVCSHLEFWV